MGIDIVRGRAYLLVMKKDILNWHVDELSSFMAEKIFFMKDFNAFMIDDITHPQRYNEVARYMPTDWYFTPKIEPMKTVRPDLTDDRREVMDKFMNYELEDGTIVKDLVEKAGWYDIEYLSM